MKLQKIAYTGPGHAPEVPVFSGNPPQAKKNRKDAQKRRDKRTLLEQDDLPPTTKMIKVKINTVATVVQHNIGCIRRRFKTRFVLYGFRFNIFVLSETNGNI